jgi:subtilase family serine protease
MCQTKLKNPLNTKTLVAIVFTSLLLTSSCSSVFAAVLPTAQNTSDQPLQGYVLQGPAPAAMTVLVDIAIPLRNIGQLSSAVKQVSDPTSSAYGHFLSQNQIESEFLPVAEYNSMLAYLASARLPIVAKALDSIIVVQATVAQVRQFFHSDVNMYTNGTCSYYMTPSDSTVNGAHLLASNVSTLLAKHQIVCAPEAASPNANLTYTKSGMSASVLPEVYNATPLYAQGFRGENQTIGIVDFYGSPTVEEDLQLFNERYGFPQAKLNIISIGPYNPNLGAYLGWSTEVALDVQMAHAMAPKAELDLYVASGSLSVASIIAQIVSLNRISTLSMSLSFAMEYHYQLYGGEWFYFNMYLPDIFFMIGSLQGITFLCSSGDAGGCGYSNGPAGNSGFPSDSPYVTSVGGTQTYFYTQPNGTVTSVQTGWSNRAYVPDDFNAGGGGGGVSFLEPKPWYQQSQQTPPSYPNGRMEPDLSLQAGIFPGIYIIDDGVTRITGGTSASAPILAGFVALMAQSANRPLGLINPLLYSLGNNASLYTKAYTPITFGYTVPWTASFGYNLVTGWGAPNIGQIDRLNKNHAVQPSLSVDVNLEDTDGYYPDNLTPNQTILVKAQIMNGNTLANQGNFTAKLVTLSGMALATSMAYDSSNKLWVCALTAGEQSGVAYVDVSGTSGNLSGEGVAETFAGYLTTFYYPSPLKPWTTANDGLQVILAATDIYGNPAPNGTHPIIDVKSYSILDNEFVTEDTLALSMINDSELGLVYAVNLVEPYTAGPLTLMMRGSTYGFLPITNGIYLQTTVMYPEVVAEPGVLAPGQYLTLVTVPGAPTNVAGTFSYETGGTLKSDIASGSSVTAYLVNPAGEIVSGVDLVYQNSKIRGALQVPANASSGLYTVLLVASYDCASLGCTLQGFFFGQVWVSNGTITPQITLSPSTLYMGQTTQVLADIRYPNGQEVTQGTYTTAIYPQSMQTQYADITYIEYSAGTLTPLTFNPTLNRWVANIALPSTLNAGVVAPIQGSQTSCSGTYEAYVTGISYDGYPTTTALSAQKSFTVQPYLYIANQAITASQQNWGLALTGVTISGSANLAGSVFLDANYVQASTATISDSAINGTLFVTNSTLTFVGVHGGNIVATNSTLNLINSNVASIATTNTALSLISSSYGTINPSTPAIQIVSPSNGGSYKGDLTATVIVSGKDVNSVAISLNSQVIQTFGANGTQTFTLHTANYPDGTYLMQATATQTNGISTSANVTMYFVNQANSLQSGLNSLNSTQSTLQSQTNNLQNNLNSGQSSLQSQIGSLNQNLNNLNSSQSAFQNQLGDLGSSLNSNISSLNASQSELQNQIQNQLNNLDTSVNNLNSTQPAVQSQIENLGSNMTSSLDALHTQIADLENSLNTTQTMAFAGIGIGIAGIAIAIFVVSRRQKTSAPSNLSTNSNDSA